MKTSHQAPDVEAAETAEDVLQPQLAAVDEHAREDLAPEVVDALFPADLPEVEDAAQAEVLARLAAKSARHHRAVVVPGDAIRALADPLDEHPGH